MSRIMGRAKRGGKNTPDSDVYFFIGEISCLAGLHPIQSVPCSHEHSSRNVGGLDCCDASIFVFLFRPGSDRSPK